MNNLQLIILIIGGACLAVTIPAAVCFIKMRPSPVPDLEISQLREQLAANLKILELQFELRSKHRAVKAVDDAWERNR